MAVQGNFLRGCIPSNPCTIAWSWATSTAVRAVRSRWSTRVAP